MQSHSLSLYVSLLLALAPAAAGAQTGPFTEGELLVRFPHPSTGQETLSRIDPVTGASAPLSSDVVDTYAAAGWIAYDGYRAGLLAYTATVSLGIFAPRLVLIRDDGDLADLGHLGAGITALASAGDGRVYLRKAGVLHLLDKQHQLTPVLAGGQPVLLPVEHLIYDQPSNALLGVAINQATTACSGFGLSTAHKLPLSADGKSLAGPIVCTSYDTGMPAASPVGIDRLPGGDYLVTLADGYPADHQLLRLDPVSMTLSLFAKPSYSDLDGGVWSQTLGRAVVLEDGGNTLRSYQAGEQGAGTLIPTAALGPDPFTGWSSANKLADVNVIGPVCGGDAQAFGTGLAGTSSFVPGLGAAGCPAIGQPLPLVVSGGTAAPALIGLSLATAAYPLFGGTGYLLPPLIASVPVVLPGPVAPAFGTAVIPVPPTPPLIGVHVFAQAGVLDPGAPQGVALSRGLELVIGG
jgi:hypothetical protein